MLRLAQLSRAPARAAILALVALIALGGVPASAFAAMTCATSEAHCPKHTAREGHCSEYAAVMSCACHGAEQPANSSSNRLTDLVPAGAPHATPSHVTHAASAVGLSRPDYPLVRGRYFVPLPILHASLLI